MPTTSSTSTPRQQIIGVGWSVPDPSGPVIDGLLAASAKAQEGWTMVSRNTTDLARSGVPVINPFDWPSGS